MKAASLCPRCPSLCQAPTFRPHPPTLAKVCGACGARPLSLSWLISSPAYPPAPLPAFHHFFSFYTTNETAIDDAVNKTLTQYPSTNYDGNEWYRASAVLTDWFFACGTRRSARAIEAAGVDIWLYQVHSAAAAAHSPQSLPLKT